MIGKCSLAIGKCYKQRTVGVDVVKFLGDYTGIDHTRVYGVDWGKGVENGFRGFFNDLVKDIIGDGTLRGKKLGKNETHDEICPVDFFNFLVGVMGESRAVIVDHT